MCDHPNMIRVDDTQDYCPKCKTYVLKNNFGWVTWREVDEMTFTQLWTSWRGDTNYVP